MTSCLSIAWSPVRDLGGSGELKQINWSVIVRLSAEFQTFAIDLHDLGAETFARWVSQGSFEVQTVTRNALTLARKLDTGNVHTESLKEDFRRLGVDLWDGLRRRHAWNEERRQHLDRLNRARNAIVHGQQDRIRDLKAEGFPLTLRTARRWRSALDELAGHMDALVAESLGQLFQQPPPW
jgi:hypothetical protein